MLLGSKSHTAGDTRRWEIDYSRWLDNTVDIESVDVTSSSTTCTVQSNEILGDTVIFFLTGGTVGETLTVTLAMQDTAGNTKTDTLSFHVISP